MVHIFNFYSNLVLLIPMLIMPVRPEDAPGVCTNKAGNEENMDCTSSEHLPGSSTEHLQPSLFPFVPPTLKFKFFMKNDADDHANQQMPKSVPTEIRKYLKWADLRGKSEVVKNVLSSSGFTTIPQNEKESNYEWLGSWQNPGKCNSPYQKVHRFPNYNELDDKAKMWRNVKRGNKILGKESFDFIPETYILPSDMEDFKIAYKKSGNQLWMVKKPGTVWGRGMYAIRNPDKIPKSRKSTSVVQKFLQNQYLINGKKVDIRFYVLTTSYNPLRVYMANEYIVMTARSNFTIETGDPCLLIVRHTDVNPEKCKHIIESDPTGSTIIGSKSQLFAQMTADGLDAERFEEKFHDGVVKILLTTLRPPGNEIPNFTRYNAYKLWGADVLIDEHGNPVILEFNAYPSTAILKGNGEDILERMKKTLISDALSTLGFNLPPFMSTRDKELVMRSLNVTNTLDAPVFDERLYQTDLSEEAKLKQEKYRSGSRPGSTSYRDSILDDLTPDDVRQLMLAEDELSRSTKGFKRLYPHVGMEKYIPLSMHDPYYDMLFDAWETKYHLNRTAGIQRLQILAEQKYHLLK